MGALARQVDAIKNISRRNNLIVKGIKNEGTENETALVVIIRKKKLWNSTLEEEQKGAKVKFFSF